MKRAIAFQTITVAIISVAVLVTVLFAYYIYSNVGFRGIGKIVQSGEQQSNITSEALKPGYNECLLWLEQRDCAKYNRSNCKAITGKECPW